jgi:glycosyltransferase involved in cell wall biosynthesis
MIGGDRGDGSLRKTQRTASELGVADRVSTLEGVPHSEVPRWLSQGDVFLNTTNIDNTPMSVLEAMASGLCVVSTNVGGIPNLVTHGHNALLYAPDDAQGAADAIVQVTTQTDLAKRLSANARTLASQFDWSFVLPQWDELLMSAMRTDPMPASTPVAQPERFPVPDCPRDFVAD